MNSFESIFILNSFFIDVAMSFMSSVKFVLLVFIPIPTTIHFAYSPLIFVCVSIPPTFLFLNIISFGFLISKLILYFSLNIFTIISAISMVIPFSFSILQFNFRKNENAILSVSSVRQILPCVPFPAV